MAGQPVKLLDRLRHACRVRHYSLRTETAYHDWCRRFILFHDKRHPLAVGAAGVSAFLTRLAVDRGVGPGTQNQALNALLFLYRQVQGWGWSRGRSPGWCGRCGRGGCRWCSAGTRCGGCWPT